MIKRWLKKVFLYLFLALTGIYLLLVVGLYTVSLFAGGDVDLSSSKKEVFSEHKMKLLDSGLDSLRERILLIRGAKKTIELEFFIFDLDDSARLLMHELIDRAQAGVKVRLLVDFSQPIFKLSPAYAKYLKEQGIEIRYYNTAPIYRFASVQHRSHRKILIADDLEAIVGGRNIADEYFDMDPVYNFLDTDVWVRGEIVPFIRQGFDQYFDSELASSPETESIDGEQYSRIVDFFKNREASSTILSKLNIDKHELPLHTCSNIIFITDPPSSSSDHRQIFSTLLELSADIEKRVDIESPYFVVGKGGYDIFKALSDKNIDLHVVTNGLYSTDATYVVSSLVYKLWSLSKIKLNLSVMNGNPVREQTSSDFVNVERWGLHAKRMVIDNKHTLVGTYNIDPRSANLNSELVIICKNNPQFAGEVLKSMDLRKSQSSRVITNGSVENYSAITDKASWKQQFTMYLMLPLTNMLEFLL